MKFSEEEVRFLLQHIGLNLQPGNLVHFARCMTFAHSVARRRFSIVF